jgi:hypothetical protein
MASGLGGGRALSDADAFGVSTPSDIKAYAWDRDAISLVLNTSPMNGSALTRLRASDFERPETLP